jgi:uncharacterized protein YecE (DUF72 family)
VIHIGTSGWHYKHWRGNFYPEKLPESRMLEAYVEKFRTVELNTTFYRLPPPDGVRRWRDSTPDDFCFAAKGSRYLTHMKKLKDPEAGLEKYLDRIEPLGKKLGPILFQLPPQWPVDVERFAHFLHALPKRHRYAFEFRNRTWDSKPIYDLLRSHNAAYCIYHLEGFQSPLEITADFTYTRLHGPGGKYQGDYDDASLKTWARRIKRWRLKDSYVYFDNDQAGYAPKNALRLQELTGG